MINVSFRMTTGWALIGLLTCAPSIRASGLKVNVNASVQNEQGGDVSLDDRASGARRAFQMSPELSMSWKSKTLGTDIRLTPSLEVPSRRPGKPLSSLEGAWRLRLTPTWRTQVDARVQMDRIVFDRTTSWSGRTGLNSGLSGSLGLSPSLYLTAGYTYARSNYTQEAPAQGVQQTSARQDQRHGLRGGLIWSGDRVWLSGGAGFRRNRSTLSAYGYDGFQADLGGGIQSGPFSFDVQGSSEWRRYGQGGTLPSRWRSLWVSAEADYQLTSYLTVFAGMQRDYGYQNGQQTGQPWTLTSAGLRINFPAHPTLQHKRLQEDPLRPHLIQGGWRFRFRRPGVSNVHLIGTFSGWDPKTYALRPASDPGLWEIVVPLKPGVYQYAFLVDGVEWVAPQGSPVYVDDGFGHQNGVLVIETDEKLTTR